MRLWLQGLVAVLLGAGAITSLAQAQSAPPAGQPAKQSAPPAKHPDPPGAGSSVAQFPRSPALVAQGRALYAQGCASCHGLSLQGRKGTAPALRDVGAGPVDFYLSTGRMPLQDPRTEPLRTTPLYGRHQIQALIAYISSFGGPPAPAANPAAGNLAQGFHLFSEDCAGCHSIVARGGITVDAQIPDLQSATAQQIAEAVRMGPYLMPHFDAKQINQHQLDSLARYVLWTRRPDDAGGWGIYNIGPIPEGIVAWFMGLAALVLVARLIGERMEGRTRR